MEPAGIALHYQLGWGGLLGAGLRVDAVSTPSVETCENYLIEYLIHLTTLLIFGSFNKLLAPSRIVFSFFCRNLCPEYFQEKFRLLNRGWGERGRRGGP